MTSFVCFAFHISPRQNCEGFSRADQDDGGDLRCVRAWLGADNGGLWHAACRRDCAVRPVDGQVEPRIDRPWRLRPWDLRRSHDLGRRWVRVTGLLWGKTETCVLIISNVMYICHDLVCINCLKAYDLFLYVQASWFVANYMFYFTYITWCHSRPPLPSSGHTRGTTSSIRRWAQSPSVATRGRSNGALHAWLATACSRNTRQVLWFLNHIILFNII